MVDLVRSAALCSPLAVALVCATFLTPAPAKSLDRQGPLAGQAGAPLPFVPARADGVTARLVAAADALIALLEDDERRALLQRYDDEEQRARWSNLPTGIVARRGARMGDLDSEEQAAVHTVLRALLSQDGYREVVDNVTGDQVLAEQGSGGNLSFGAAEFYVAFLGAPSLERPWGFQFGGHHLALNATVVGERITLAPSLTGGQPMRYERDGRKVELMAKETAAARKLLAALDEDQRAASVQGEQKVDLSWGPGREEPDAARNLPAPVGIAGAQLDATQRALLRALIAARVGLLNDEDAGEALKRIERHLDATHFAWFGPTEEGAVASYRVQGPGVFIEFAPQGRGAGDPQHVHAIWRDPSNEYGRGFARPKEE